MWTPEIDKVQGFQLTGLGRAYGPPTSFSGSFCALLRNDGGQFTDISQQAGIQVATPDLKMPIGKSLGVAPYDVDGDGLVDIAVANDTVQNFFFHNKGQGKFEEMAIVTGIAFDQSGLPRGGMGADWGAFHNDGRLGLAIGNFANEMTALYVCDQPTTLQFSDLANLFGLGAPPSPRLNSGCSSSILIWMAGSTSSRPTAISSPISPRCRPVRPMPSQCRFSGTPASAARVYFSPSRPKMQALTCSSQWSDAEPPMPISMPTEISTSS